MSNACGACIIDIYLRIVSLSPCAGYGLCEGKPCEASVNAAGSHLPRIIPRTLPKPETRTKGGKTKNGRKPEKRKAKTATRNPELRNP